MQFQREQGVEGRRSARRSLHVISQALAAPLIAALATSTALAALSGCSPGSEQPTFTPPSYYKPGVALSRISCSCLACVSAGACEGRAPMARDELGCKDGFQMQTSTRFEATVSGCQPSCFKRNWSVPDSKDCEDQLPDDCCPD